MTWTTRQLEILEITTRVGSVFSLLGAAFIIITFCVSPEFHKPINRLAFFAAFGNILTNVATLISQEGILAYERNPHAGLCKMQAMFIQWFMPADALFCAAMALNVYLTVFKKYSSHRLQKLEVPYVLACYGIPLIPALVFLFITKERGTGTNAAPLYGPATLWCWVSDEWQILRIAAFYGPVWVVLFFTFAIYILAGKVIFRLRSTLRGFARDVTTSLTTTTGNFGSTAGETITSMPSAMVNTGGVVSPGGHGNGEGSMDSQGQAMQMVGSHNSMVAKVPILSDAEPVAGVTMHENQPYAYSCTVETGRMPIPSTTAAIIAARQKSAMEANTAAWAYCRCAMLFFLALVITWLPSSINRVYTVVYPGATNFGLNFASALVLPCQGFWNGLIYITTTLPACKSFFWTIQDKYREVLGKPAISRRRRRRGTHRSHAKFDTQNPGAIHLRSSGGTNGDFDKKFAIANENGNGQIGIHINHSQDLSNTSVESISQSQERR